MSRKLKILALHGWNGNGRHFSKVIKHVVAPLSDIAEFSFASAPTKKWWNATHNFTVYEGIEESERFIKEFVEKEGPFDGIIAHSQGAAFAGIIAAKRLFPFKFAILISGFPSRAAEHQFMVKKGFVENLPSFHIIGLKDDIVPPERTRQYAEMFEMSKIWTHPEGHLPEDSNWPVEEIREFIMNQEVCRSILSPSKL